MKETLDNQQQNNQEQDTSRNFMNGNESSHASADTSSKAPTISQSVPYGEDQGGLLDWFKGIFGFGKQKKQEEADDSGWQEKTNENEYVTDKPNVHVGRPLYDFEKDATVGGEEKMQPVFETHSFMPKEEVDQVSGGHLHSFIGLRYTKFDEDKGKLRRKSAKIGFGGSSTISPISTGGWMNDTNTQADMSTETPISMASFNNVIAAIDQVNNNMQSEAEGNGSGEGLSGKYNLLLNNCNNFVENMARVAGAKVPANLHHSILGPAGAYRQLANGAQNGQQGGTRFFQGGGMRMGQMSTANRKSFLLNFRTEADRTLALDSIDFKKDPGLEPLVNNLVTSAQFLSAYVGENAAESPDSAGEKAALSACLDQITKDVRAVVEYDGSTPHPRINISALKVEALAKVVRNERFPVKRGLKDLTPRELAYRLENSSEEEMHAGAGRDVKNADLFSDDNLRTNDFGTAAAEIFMQATGIDDIADFSYQAGKGLRGGLAVLELLRRIADKIRNSDDKMLPYLRQYLSARRGITPRQHAELITVNILRLFNKLNLSATYRSQLRASDKNTGETLSGDLTEEQQDLVAEAQLSRELFLNPNGFDPNSSSGVRRGIEERTTQLNLSKEIENAVYDKILVIIGENG